MTIKLAILGAGEIAEKHLNSLNKISDFKVNYICDIDLLKANKLARKCTESMQKLMKIRKLQRKYTENIQNLMKLRKY